MDHDAPLREEQCLKLGGEARCWANRPLSEQEIYFASKAIVDAALIIQSERVTSERGNIASRDKFRAALIDLVKQDPIFSAQLFRNGVCTIQ